jgi:hypothetical protein
MGTTTSTQSTNQYNPSGMNAYNAFQPQIMSNLMQMVNNPLGSSFFQNQLQQQLSNTRQLGARSNSNLLQNMRAGGGILSNSAGFMAGALNRNQLGNNFMQGNAFNHALNGALSNRGTALMSMQAYQPLQTGQNSTQSTGGLGTWLPQLIGAGLGAAGGAMTGGFGGGLSGAVSGMGGGYSGARAPAYSGPPTSGGMGGNYGGAFSGGAYNQPDASANPYSSGWV